MKVAQKLVTIVQKIVHRVLQWPSKTVHQIYLLGPIKTGRQADRMDRVRSHNRNLSVLTAEETALAHGLSEQGFCVTNFGIFTTFAAENFSTATNEIYRLMEKNYLETGKTIDIINLLGAEPSLLDQFKIVFRAGLDLKLLRIVENYLQLPVAYGGVDIFFTVADGSERGARIWHRDSEDTPMVKVAVYLNDVGDSDGPLEILHLRQTSSDFDTARNFRQQKLLDLQNEGEIKFDIQSFVGPRGTVVFCDTFKYFHRGKPATGRNRKALFFNYYTSKPLTPYFCPNPPFALDTMKDLISDLSATQKDAALWRENLTGIDKIVTKRKPYLNL